jgi:UDP-2,3-diacylglucosamine pyrophosphatase LpxH
MLGAYLEGNVGNWGDASIVTAFPYFDHDEPAIPEPSPEGRRRYRTIWISDIHLGTKGCNAEMLIDFLDSTDSETMYLVGDIIDGWRLKKKFYWPPAHNDVVWRILKRARRGTRIVYIPGNHDEMFRQFSGLNFGGVEIRRAAFHETADGRRLMVLHGDEFDGVMLAHRWLAFVGDALYALVMGLSHRVNVIRRWLGLPYWSLSKMAKHKVKNAVAFIYRYEELVARAAAARKARRSCLWAHSHRRAPQASPESNTTTTATGSKAAPRLSSTSTGGWRSSIARRDRQARRSGGDDAAQTDGAMAEAA